MKTQGWHNIYNAAGNSGITIITYRVTFYFDISFKVSLLFNAVTSF